jgi:2,3-bisphosphoglycerate-dependent phosphoglycerate mutase
MPIQDRTEILLIRHAESQPSRELPEADWPLSLTGVRQAQELAEALQRWQIDAVFSSPYARAKATIEPFAQAVGLQVHVLATLRERKLTEGHWDDWLALLQQAWSDFSLALPHGESSYDCQQRVCQCLAQLAADHRGQTLLVCSHGNAIALYLNSIDQAFGFEAWAVMQNPDVFRITYDAGKPLWHKSFKLRG